MANAKRTVRKSADVWGCRQVAQLSQRNRAAGWVSSEWVMGDSMGQIIRCIKRCRCQKTKSIDLSHDNPLYEKQPLGIFELLFGGLGVTYAVHLRLIGKPVVDFILVIIELFFARCYGSGATSEYRLEVAVFEEGGSPWSKILGRRGRPPPTICARLDMQASDCSAEKAASQDRADRLKSSTQLLRPK